MYGCENAASGLQSDDCDIILLFVWRWEVPVAVPSASSWAGNARLLQHANPEAAFVVSYDYHVYVREADLPCPDVLARGLSGATSRVEFRVSPDFLRRSGFLPVEVQGVASGFEVSSWAITDQKRSDYEDELVEDGEQDDGYRDLLARHTHTISFHCHAGNGSVELGRRIALYLAEAAHGVFCDPQTGEKQTF